MAFTLRNLWVLAYGIGFTLWHYKSGYKLAAAAAQDYFADIAALMAPGEMVMLSTGEGDKIVTIAGQVKFIALAPLC